MGLSVMCITEDFYEENGNRQLKQILGIIMKEKSKHREKIAYIVRKGSLCSGKEVTQNYQSNDIPS